MSLRLLSLVAVAVVASCSFAANPTPEEKALRQQVDKLQAQHAAAEQQIAALKAQLNKAKGNDIADDKTIANFRQQVDQLQAELKKAKGNDASSDKTIKSLQSQLDVMRKAKFAHTIVYKAKADTSKTEMQALADDANLFFATVKSVRGVWAGKANADVGIAAEYQVVIVLLFDDSNGFQVFQNDAQWKRFTDKHAKMWEDPKSFDLTVGK